MKSRQESSRLAPRITIARLFAWTGLTILILRLWFLQGVYGTFYRDRSENNRLRAVRTEPARGVIYDREGRVLVRNRPAFNIAALLEDVPDFQSSFDELASHTTYSKEEIKERFEGTRKSQRFEPRIVLHDVSHKELAHVKANSHRLPGFIVTTQPKRSYPHQSLAAQILGYTREISGAQLEQMGRERYRPGDIVGQSGLEKEHEALLGGKAGYVQVEVDARGRRRAELGIIDTVPGNDLYLTIDLDLQTIAEEAFEGRKGTVVGLDPRNGEVLVMASLPSFNPNLFSSEMSSKEWRELTTDKGKPLRNRAISSLYPPGSTIKLFWALAALAEGVIDESTTYNCPGFYSIRGRRFHCHKRAGHGRVNLMQAIHSSCNVYFYQVGLEMGIDRLSTFMEKLGFGQLTGIRIAGEEEGTLPSRKWKKARFGERWYDGDTLPVAIGQGYLSVTPIQMATMVAALSNDGKVFRPHLVSKIVDSKTGELRTPVSELIRELEIDPKLFELVRRASQEVVEHQRGTGKRAGVEGVAIGGKTGTSQVISLKASQDSEEHKDHSLFVGLAPVEDPTLVLFVLVEHGGHGGSAAAPIAGKIFRKYFEKKGVVAPIVEEPTDGQTKLQRARLDADGLR